MDIHKNARLTFIRREQLAQCVLLQQMTLGAAAAAFHVTSRTAAKWTRRYRQEGPAGLEDRSSRPHRCPRRTGEGLAQRVEQLRRQRFTGLHIAQATGLSRATVSRILRRLGLNRMRDLEPAIPILRYEHAAPGDLLHLDIKQLGRFSDVALRPDGRRRGKHHSRWEYLHVAIDDHSRIAFAQVLPTFTAAAAVAFLYAAVAYYASLGISIRRLLTDNGHCYRSHAFRAAVLQLGLHHHFTRPYTPRTNGKAERLIQTALREWIYACSYLNSEERNAQLRPWLHHYNWHRPHGSLNRASPISRSGLDRDNLLRLHSYPLVAPNGA
jgi:transposase InsO family protein